LFSKDHISIPDLSAFLKRELSAIPAAGRKVLVIIPDGTRTLPMRVLFSSISKGLLKSACKVTFLIANGTHRQMSEKELGEHLGENRRNSSKGRLEVLQHEWENPDVLRRIGTIPREEAHSVSRGLLDEDVPIRINRAVLEHDLCILLGPVFPHELIGFSGGYKYFFPGVSGPELVHQTHWLGSVVVNPNLHGVKDTPVRQLVHRAASMVATPTRGISLVMKGHELKGIFFGSVEEAWSRAADLSAQENIVQVEEPFHTVIACVPGRYHDLWLGSKSMTKVQNVVKDGGKLILYAPHIRDPAPGHGDWHRKIGYHLPEYVLRNMESFRDVPRAVLGDLIQLRGTGTLRNGAEVPRIRVVVATGIPEDECRRMNLEFLEPSSVRLEEYEGKEREGILVVRDAGEVLWRVADMAPNRHGAAANILGG